MSDRMNQKRRRAYEEKEKKFMENHKRNKETKHLYAAKTDCLLVCSDSDPFFGSRITQTGQVKKGDTICVYVSDGRLQAEVTDIQKDKQDAGEV